MRKSIGSFIGGMLVAALLLGGVGVVRGSTFAQSTEIVLCAHKKTGNVRHTKKKCSKSETQLVMNSKGLDGVAGPQGQQGIQGVPGQDRVMVNNANIVPSDFGALTRIWREPTGCCDLSNNSLYIHTTIKDYDSRALSWTALSPSDTFNLWVEFFDENGSFIEYQEPSVDVYTSPAGSTITAGQKFSYELRVSGIHNNLPAGAEYFRVILRPHTSNFGTILHGAFAYVSTSITPVG